MSDAAPPIASLTLVPGLARMRRIAAILAVAAYLLPSVPHFFGPPRNPHFPLAHDGRAECAIYSFALIGSAFIVALFGARGVKPREYWPKVAAIGLWYFVALALLPYGW